MTATALSNGFAESTLLDCSAGVQVGNRWFKNYESASYGPITFAQALQISCDTFFYRVGMTVLAEVRHRPAQRERQGPAGLRGQGLRDRQPDRHRHPGGVERPDRRPALEAVVLEGHEGLLLQDRQEGLGDGLPAGLRARVLRSRATCTARATRSTSSIGQGDTLVTPLQLARAYAALSNGGTLYEPRVAKAVVSPTGEVIKKIPPKVQGHVKVEEGRAATTSTTPCRARPEGRHARPGSSSTSRWTRSGSAARPARPRSTASRAPRGSRRTTRTTWW